MKFSLWRRVQALTYDEIDEKIDDNVRHAQDLVKELEDTLEQQGELLRQVREGNDDHREPE